MDQGQVSSQNTRASETHQEQHQEQAWLHTPTPSSASCFCHHFRDVRVLVHLYLWWWRLSLGPQEPRRPVCDCDSTLFFSAPNNLVHNLGNL